jgi:hypothetical protein
LLLYSPWRDASRRGANFPESEETMPDLPIRRMLVYRHGVGYFERRGSITGAELRL